MPKLKPTMTILDGPVPYLVSVGTPFRNGIAERFKAMPGREWLRDTKRWLYPIECMDELKVIASDFGFEFKDLRNPKGLGNSQQLQQLDLPKDLRPFQIEGVISILRDRAHMVNFETGLGKSRTAIEAMLVAEAFVVLIVCPASVRLNWVDELRLWAGDCGRPFRVIANGKEAENYFSTQGIVITSYELVKKLPTNIPWNAIVLDESHYLKEKDSDRSAALVELSVLNPKALKILLTATPICDQPKDLWHQLEIMYPGRFGSFYQFKDAYCDKAPDEYASSGWRHFGVNRARAPELAERLKAVSTRMTKKDAAQWLPKCVVSQVRIEAKGSGKLDSSNLEALCENLGNLKLTATADQIELDLAAGATHVCVLTYYRRTAELLVKALKLGPSIPVVHVSGDITPAKRHQILAEAKALPRCVLVATMHSVVEGIDLTKFTEVIFSELYWQPKVLVQTMGRFWRMSSQLPVNIRFLIVQRSMDEVIARRVLSKTQDMGTVIAHGEADSKLESALGIPEMTEDEFLLELSKAASSRIDDEY